MISKLGFEVKLTKDRGSPEKWDDPKMWWWENSSASAAAVCF